MCRAARGEAEGWKSRTLQAEAQIADLRLQLNDYRMQLGLPVLEADDANAPHGALPWHKSDEHTDIGAILDRNVPADQAKMSSPRMHMRSLCPSPESCKPASKPKQAYQSIASDQIEYHLLADGMLPCAATVL